MSCEDIAWKGYAYVFMTSFTRSLVVSQATSIRDTKNWDKFEVIDFQPKEPGDYDLDIKIDYCGVCGSDVSVYSV